MNNLKFLILGLSLAFTGCTTGQLYYLDKNGDKKLACDVEFSGLPWVDKYAVEYSLSLCAKSVVKKGGIIEEMHLLKVDTSIPSPPCGVKWNHPLAKQMYKSDKLSKKEYGYIVAHIDLGLAEVNQCSPNKPS
ncbi:hypothetical protein ACUR5C_02505 [Aliikangiella sp. IMCC44653]